jgi:hypothetical protein
MESKAVIAAGTRFKEAWEKPSVDIVEVHEAALGLIWVTETTDLQAALDVLADIP